MDMRNSFGDNIHEDNDGGDEKQCRACLQQHHQHQVYSLDSKNLTVMDDGSEQTIAEIYHQCTQLVYEPVDDHLKWICQYCIEKMIDFCQFRKMCIDSYNTLKQTQELEDKSLKTELTDEHDDSPIFGMEHDNAAVAKTHENSFDCSSVRMNDQIVQTNLINDNVDVIVDEKTVSIGWDMALVEAKADISTQEQTDDEEEEGDDGNDADFNFEDESESSKSSEDNIDASDQINEQQLPAQRNSIRQTRKKMAKTKAAKNSTSKNNSNAEKPKPNEPIYACDKCPRKFFKDYRYNAHMRRHMGLKAYKCEHCDKEFQKMGTLKAHTAAKHYDESEGQPPVYSCDVDGCGKSYSIKESLRIHIQNVHLGRKPAVIERICELCGKSFSSNAALVKHSYSHTKVTPFKCDLCSRMMASAYKLKEHVMRHNKIKNFVCPTCGMRKTTGHELRVHMRYHSTDLKFNCELCSQVFTRDANRKRHMRVVHCGVKAYKCTHCDQAFGKAETLKHHVMTHTGERPHACTLCNKSFIQSVALKTHMKTHNKNK